MGCWKCRRGRPGKASRRRDRGPGRTEEVGSVRSSDGACWPPGPDAKRPAWMRPRWRARRCRRGRHRLARSAERIRSKRRLSRRRRPRIRSGAARPVSIVRSSPGAGSLEAFTHLPSRAPISPPRRCRVGTGPERSAIRAGSGGIPSSGHGPGGVLRTGLERRLRPSPRTGYEAPGIWRTIHLAADGPSRSLATRSTTTWNPTGWQSGPVRRRCRLHPAPMTRWHVRWLLWLG